MLARTVEHVRHTVRIHVWDPFVRLFHWTVVSGCLIAYVFTDWRNLHKFTGYVVLAMVVLRIIWGFVGTRHARFADFVRSPREVWDYGRRLLQGREDPSLGHNPLGGLMVVALLTTLLAIGISGWMMTLDAFWGEDWVEELHANLVNLLLVLVGLHLAGVLFTSLRERVNLVKAMITGYKEFPAGKAPPAADAEHSRAPTAMPQPNRSG